MARWIALGNEVEDDRGVRHAVEPLAGPVRFLLRVTMTSFRFLGSESERDPVLRAALLGRSELRDAMSPGARIAAWLMVIVLLMLLCVIGIVNDIGDGVPERAALRGGILCVIPTLPRWEARARARRRRELRTLPPVRLVCDYDLSGLSAQPDGCTVCPECGAEWRIGDSGRGAES